MIVPQNKLRITRIELLKVGVFFLYNISYVLYVRGYIPQSINLFLIVLFIGLNMLDFLVKNEWKLRKHTFFKRELWLVLWACIVIAAISLIIQLRNHNLQSYMFTGILHIVFFWIHSTSKEVRDVYFTIFVIRFLFHFILIGAGGFNVNNILAISWFDSKSSVFESSNAHDLLFLVLYYKYRNKKAMSIICMILCMLSFKRLSFILAPLCIIFYDKITDKPVPKSLLLGTKVFFTMSPFIYFTLMSDALNIYFVSQFGITVNQFMTGRLTLVKTVLNQPKILNGYDSTTDFFMHNGFLSWNMHCDVMKLYLETTIVSLIVVVNNFFEIVKKDFRLYLMMVYAFIVLVTSHFLDYISGWIIIYMIVAVVYFDKIQQNDNTQKHTNMQMGQ